MSTAWPEVPVDEHGYMLCPMPLCSEELHLVRTYGITLVAEQALDHEPEHAIADEWKVECVGGHIVLDSVDAARAINAVIDDPDSEDLVDETGESSIAYDHLLTHQRVSRLWGAR